MIKSTITKLAVGSLLLAVLTLLCWAIADLYIHQGAIFTVCVLWFVFYLFWILFIGIGGD